MGLRIFENDPESAPRPKRSSFADDLVGRFRSGYQINGRPSALEKWRVTTGDPSVADRIQELLGGEPAQEWEAKGEDNLEIFTEAESVEIILENAGAIRSEMILWGRSGAIRKCDGVEQKGDDAGTPCVCPSSFSDRKDAAKNGRGCEPSITIFFRLAEDPELGLFKFTSGSWSLAREIGLSEEALSKVEGSAKASLTLELVEYEAQGKKRRFTKPVVTIKGAVK
jgi:hypothetical protein